MTNVIRQKTWLAALFAALLVAGFCADAHAQSAHTIVAALGEDLDPRLVASLRAELGLRSLSLVIEPSLPGVSREARQEAAQARAEAAHAHATLWLEEGLQVHALAADGNHRYAVLPRRAGRVSPRVFAVIAMSALDELNIVVPALEVEEAPVVAPPPNPPVETLEATSTQDAATEDGSTDEPAQPAQEEPAQEEPAQEEPAQEEPAQEEPAQEEPADARPFDLSNPVDPTPARASDVRDGEVHGYFALDGMVGAVWIFNAANNIAHILQRFTGGLQWELLRAEFSGSFGLEQGLDGSHAESAMGDFVFFLGAGIPVGDVSLDVGALGGLVLHGLTDSSLPRSGDILTSGRFGGAFGVSTPDANSALVFRARIELGLFARLDPGLATLFTNVVLGIGFR